MSYSDRINEYLEATRKAKTHTGKLITFSELVKSIFGVSSCEIVENVEQYVKSGKVLVLKGRMDLRLGQTILEFKIDLKKELEDAIEEIERERYGSSNLNLVNLELIPNLLLPKV